MLFLSGEASGTFKGIGSVTSVEKVGGIVVKRLDKLSIRSSNPWILTIRGSNMTHAEMVV